MKTETELLDEMISDSEWSLRYHESRLQAEIQINNPDKWQVDYHAEQVLKNTLMIEKLKK